jgi:magnesium transporter
VALRTRDAVSELTESEHALFEESTAPYLRDVLDHATQAVDLAHFYTSTASDIGTFIVGTLDMRMNEVMKILAGVTVIFMPLTLIAGIYGMNFSNMPETKTSWGYFAALGVILLLGAILTIWMRRIGWLRRDAE